MCRDGACLRICSSDLQCKGEGQACVDRVCREGCTTDAGCDSDQVCDKGRCLGELRFFVEFLNTISKCNLVSYKGFVLHLGI